MNLSFMALSEGARNIGQIPTSEVDVRPIMAFLNSTDGPNYAFLDPDKGLIIGTPSKEPQKTVHVKDINDFTSSLIEGEARAKAQIQTVRRPLSGNRLGRVTNAVSMALLGGV